MSRSACVIDGGRIINLKAATNQVAGAIVMGVGMGLLEQTVCDPRSGHPVNDNVADYLVPTSAGVPNIGVAPQLPLRCTTQLGSGCAHCPCVSKTCLPHVPEK